MADFSIRMSTSRSARDCFERLVDWDAHSAAIPLTRLRHEGEPRVGQRFTARTGLGRLGFEDPMVVETLVRPAGDDPGDRPGAVEVAKLGRVIAGRVGWTVTPTTSGADVEWRQQLIVGWLPRRLDPVVGWLGRAAYRLGLRRILK